LRWSYSILPIVILLSLLGCAQPMPEPPAADVETKQIITIEARDQLLCYQCQSFWSEGKFSKLSESELKARFAGKYNVKARDFEFSFDKASHSTITKCRVYGAISKGQDRYTADFLWLLNPLGLDFIDDNFKESKHGLSWEGKLASVLTTIEVECPPQDSVYKAWQYPVGHCHGHIWWQVASYK